MRLCDKDSVAKYVFKVYRRAELSYHFGDHPYLCLLIESMLNELPQHNREFLLREYGVPYCRNWWIEYCSKSTYYRVKNESLDLFLNCLSS